MDYLCAIFPIDGTSSLQRKQAIVGARCVQAQEILHSPEFGIG